ncbi:glycosyltransferase [Salinivibrio kushneri]|uniref:Glycosyltransferase n=1 Tax=Salinivibrio kushneri TaxID=1908198 RepID=A0AB36K019_9GAMM|nr:MULTISPECIES: glycosyltransferase [Salinivibrio]ODP97973.1 glycosyl transferase [Salinivibrio sp. BNH]OOE40075.1 glycosyltransferase [Salinivibrio kushneri]QCP01090.1 glycosyltransferase [Salinivibrio kushneri]
MRVAIVVNCLKLGGMERVAVNLSDAFTAHGDDATLIYLKNRPQDIKPTSDVDVRLFDLKKSVLKTGIGALYYFICKLVNALVSKTFPLLFAYPNSFFFKRKLRQLEAEKGKFDLVIFRGQGTFEQLWPLHDDRFVYVCENIIKPHHYGAFSSIVYRAIFDYKNIVCVSEGAHKSFQSLANIHNISPLISKVISNPNNTPYIREQADRTEPDMHPRPFILGLGRLTQVKNFTLLVKAYAHLVDRCGIHQDLVIVGEGKDRENIENTVKEHNLEHRVFFKGARKNPFPWFKHADLFVLSSRFEGLGMVLLEALACDSRIVCTDSDGGVRQIMDGELEKYLSAQEPEPLADKMYKSLSSSWSDKEKSYIEEKLTEFSGEKIVSEYKKVSYV